MLPHSVVNPIDKLPGIKEILDKAQNEIQWKLGLPVSVFYKIQIHNLSLDQVANIICTCCQITLPQLKGESRIEKIIVGRHIFCWYATTWCKVSLPKVADFLGYKDHTTVWHARNKVNDMIATANVVYMTAIETIGVRIGAK
jgi:chromosomal replication initiation ATPase DnaA